MTSNHQSYQQLTRIIPRSSWRQQKNKKKTLQKKHNPSLSSKDKQAIPRWIECHPWQSDLVTDAEGHMTPHAPVSDHAEPTVPDGSDFPPPSPLSAGPVMDSCRDKAAGGAGAGWSPHRIRGREGRRWATGELSTTVTPLMFISITRLLPVPYSELRKWCERV